MSGVQCSLFAVRLPLLLLLVSGGRARAAVSYVDENSLSPSPPYTNWATAARVIQDAVDAAVAGDEIVVTNGLYATGGRAVGTNLLVNRVAVDKPLTLRSVNGPETTIIQGYQVPGNTNGDGAIRCVYLVDGATISGFRLTHGATRTNGNLNLEQSGGGLWCESTNAAASHCVITKNSAQYAGGGAYGGYLSDCTLVDNSAADAGGNLRLQSISPCINAGGNAYAPGPTDLDGRPRIANGTVDLGAYEFPAPAPGSWTRKEDLPMALGGHAACAVDGVLYVMGGGTKTNSEYVQLQSLFAYDPRTDLWTGKRDMPAARRFVSACAVEGIIYAVGGGALLTPETSAVEAYDPKTNTWVSKAPLPTARGSVAVCAVDGIIYAIGGLIGTASAGNIQALRTVEAYDPKTDQWTPRRNLPVAVTGAAVGAVNGQVYLFFDHSTFAYDPKTDQWTRKASIPSSSLMCMLTAFSTVNGIIYLFGGEISPFEGGYTLSLAYDPARDKFTAMRNLPMKCMGAAAAGIGKVIYQAGGGSGDPMNYPGGRYYSDLWVFDPEGGVFPQFLSFTRESPTNVRLLWQGEVGLRYGVQSRLNVASGTWSSLMFPTGTNAILATNVVVEATVTVPASDTRRFFRVVEAD